MFRKLYLSLYQSHHIAVMQGRLLAAFLICPDSKARWRYHSQSIHRSLPWVEFPLGHSSREAEVSGETLLCPDSLGLQQWLMHNSGPQHWGKVSESINATTDNPSFSVSMSLSLTVTLPLRLTYKMFCQEAVSLFALFWMIWTPDCSIQPSSGKVFTFSCM